MVKVTDKDYYLDGFAEQICTAIAERVQNRKQDILMLINGREGSGKTNASIALCYYIAHKTSRKFTNANIFFDIDEMMKFAGNTKEQIILWDESSLGGLAHSWTNSSQKKLKSMLMVCRKLRHVFVFNIPRFYRLSSDLIERAYCMFHIYENNEEKPGNFMFFGQQKLEYLYNEWKKRGGAAYWKYKKLHGHFTWVLPKLINEEEYEKAKDDAIMKLVNETKDKKGESSPRHAAIEAQKKIARTLWIKHQNHRIVAELIGVDRKTIGNWVKEGNWGGT